MPKKLDEYKPDEKEKKDVKLKEDKDNEEDEDGADYSDMKKKTGTLAKEHLKKLKAKKAKKE